MTRTIGIDGSAVRVGHAEAAASTLKLRSLTARGAAKTELRDGVARAEDLVEREAGAHKAPSVFFAFGSEDECAFARLHEKAPKFFVGFYDQGIGDLEAGNGLRRPSLRAIGHALRGEAVPKHLCST